MVLLALLVYAVAEIAAFVAVAEQIGVLLAVVLVLVVSALGPLLVRRAGLGVLDHARARLARGESPDADLLDGVVLLIGGAAVCIPGFIGDAIGLALLIGPVRHLLIKRAGRALARRLDVGVMARFGRGAAPGSPVVDASSHPGHIDPEDGGSETGGGAGRIAPPPEDDRP